MVLTWTTYPIACFPPFLSKTSSFFFLFFFLVLARCFSLPSLSEANTRPIDSLITVLCNNKPSTSNTNQIEKEYQDRAARIQPSCHTFILSNDVSALNFSGTKSLHPPRNLEREIADAGSGAVASR